MLSYRTVRRGSLNFFFCETILFVFCAPPPLKCTPSYATARERGKIPSKKIPLGKFFIRQSPSQCALASPAPPRFLAPLLGYPVQNQGGTMLAELRVLINR